MPLKRTFIYSIVTLCILAAGSCKKQEPISAVPSLKFVSISPNPAKQYQDEIKITIEYTDGDGDLGENTPDVKNLFVTDSRNNVTSAFRIPQQAPDNANIIIRGKLNINLPPQGFIDDTQTSETVVYSMYVVDRAGNQSNVVQSSAMVIQK